MATKRQLYLAPWVLPVSSPPIYKGMVAVEGSRIVYVGPADAYDHRDTGRAQASENVSERDNSNSSPHADRISADIIMPGLVNAHSHLELTVLRGMLEGLSFRDWLRTLTDARTNILDEPALLDSSILGIYEGLQAGITTYADTNASGAPLAAMRATGVRGIGYLEVFGPATSAATEAMSGLEQRVQLSLQLDTSLVTTGVSPHAPYTVSHELFTQLGNFARAHELPVAIHAAESEAEYEMVRHGLGPFADGLRSRGIPVRASNVSPIQYLASTGVLDETQALLIHCIRVDEADLETIAGRGCTIVHCPISNAKLGHGIAPLELMKQAGIATGLGTDSVASNNSMDILLEARMAVLLQSVLRKIPNAFSATEALRMATLGGAEALGLATSIGSLEAGKQADMTLFSRPSQLDATSFDPADWIVHALAGRLTATTVLVAGETRVSDGKVLGLQAAVLDRINDVSGRLAQWRARSR